MTFHENPTNLHRIKSLIDRLGNHWNVDQPTNPDKYEGVENVIVFTYCISSDWPEFYSLLREAQKEIDNIIETEQ